jgi:hypothetical protein
MWATDNDMAMIHRSDLRNFNPDAHHNPHDVDQTGAGRFHNPGRFNPAASSVQGGIFASEPQETQPRGNVRAINRVKARTSTDFLERLAIAEANDAGGPNMYSANRHAAGARPQSRDGFHGPAADGTQPQQQMNRADTLAAKKQAAMDRAAEVQRQRQWQAVERQGLHPGRLEGWEASAHEPTAGAKSKAFKAQEQVVGQQRKLLTHATIQHTQLQQRQHQMNAQSRAQAEAERQQAQRAQFQRQRQMERQMAMEDAQRRSRVPRAQQLDNTQLALAHHDVAMKAQWAKNQAHSHSRSGIRLG